MSSCIATGVVRYTRLTGCTLVYIYSSAFIDCSSSTEHGGAVYISSGYSTITRSLFHNCCTSSSTFHGGALYLSSVQESLISLSCFHSCYTPSSYSFQSIYSYLQSTSTNNNTLDQCTVTLCAPSTAYGHYYTVHFGYGTLISIHSNISHCCVSSYLIYYAYSGNVTSTSKYCNTCNNTGGYVNYYYSNTNNYQISEEMWMMSACC